MIINLEGQNSLINEYIAEIRDVNIQQDRMRFKRNIERLGEIFAYEISKQLSWQKRGINTSLGVASCNVLAEQPVVGSILRAGLPLQQGVLNFFDKADSLFISAYRKHINDTEKFEIELGYLACPDLNDKILIVCDPMLATGLSLVLSIKEILKVGKPKQLHIVSVIASEAGIKYVENNLSNATIWTAAIDKELNALAYIVPGLGDAGDLAYGEKMQH